MSMIAWVVFLLSFGIEIYASDWTTISFDNQRTGLNPTEIILSSLTVMDLKLAWKLNLVSDIGALGEPVVALKYRIDVFVDSPSVSPTSLPSYIPTKSASPTKSPTSRPSSRYLTLKSTSQPTCKPQTVVSSRTPTLPSKTKSPSLLPTIKPTTLTPTIKISSSPTFIPTYLKTRMPSKSPIKPPTLSKPVTRIPTSRPSKSTLKPSLKRSTSPTYKPTMKPTIIKPTAMPTELPVPICLYGSNCINSVDRCISGTYCHPFNPFYSQCLLNQTFDTSSYQSSHGYCTTSYQYGCSTTKSKSCCNPGFNCVAVGGVVNMGVCRPILRCKSEGSHLIKIQKRKKVIFTPISRELSTTTKQYSKSMESVSLRMAQTSANRVWVASVETNVAYFGDGYPNLYAVDVNKGVVAWSIFIGGAQCGPVMDRATDTLYMMSWGHFYAISMHDGHVKWNISQVYSLSAYQIHGSLLFANHTVHFLLSAIVNSRPSSLDKVVAISVTSKKVVSTTVVPPSTASYAVGDVPSRDLSLGSDALRNSIYAIVASSKGSCYTPVRFIMNQPLSYVNSPLAACEYNQSPLRVVQFDGQSPTFLSLSSVSMSSCSIPLLVVKIQSKLLVFNANTLATIQTYSVANKFPGMKGGINSPAAWDSKGGMLVATIAVGRPDNETGEIISSSGYAVGLKLQSSCLFKETWTTSLGSAKDSSLYFQTPFTPVMAGPTTNRVVFVVSGSAGDRHQIAALSLTDGVVQWSELGDSSVGTLGPIVVVNGSIFFTQASSDFKAKAQFISYRL